MQVLNQFYIKSVVRKALEEDLYPKGDITTDIVSKKNKIVLCVVSEGATAQYKDKKMILVRKDACRKCSKILGISKVIFLDFPDMKLNLSHLEINKKLERIIHDFKPEVVYTSPKNDLNLDHQAVFDST